MGRTFGRVRRRVQARRCGPFLTGSSVSRIDRRTASKCEPSVQMPELSHEHPARTKTKTALRVAWVVADEHAAHWQTARRATLQVP